MMKKSAEEVWFIEFFFYCLNEIWFWFLRRELIIAFPSWISILWLLYKKKWVVSIESIACCVILWCEIVVNIRSNIHSTKLFCWVYCILYINTKCLHSVRKNVITKRKSLDRSKCLRVYFDYKMNWSIPVFYVCTYPCTCISLTK